MRAVVINDQHHVRMGKVNAAMHEERIQRMEALIEAGNDTGYYPRSFLTTGRQESDEEYKGKYRSAGTKTGDDRA